MAECAQIYVMCCTTMMLHVIAAVQPEGMEYVTTAFLAHLAYEHCGDAAMKPIAQAPELFRDVLANDHVTSIRSHCER